MTNLEKEKVSLNLNNKVLLGIEFFDKRESAEDSSLVLKFSESINLVIQTFWRIVDKNSILAMDTERFLLPNGNAPKKDWQNLAFSKSLLSKNLSFVKKKCLNSVVNSVKVIETNDIFVELKNGIVIQGIINCRCNFYTYYSVLCNNNIIVACQLDWNKTLF